MGTAMSQQDLKEKLSQHIEAARAKLDALEADLETMHAEDMQALREKKQAMDKYMEEQREKTRKVQADIASWKQEKVAHTQEAIGSWRKKREIQKLVNRADRAEEYAIDLVINAAYDFEEAEQAVLEALAARYDAESAASSPA